MAYAKFKELKSGEISKTENELEAMLSDSYIKELAKHLWQNLQIVHIYKNKPKPYGI